MSFPRTSDWKQCANMEWKRTPVFNAIICPHSFLLGNQRGLELLCLGQKAGRHRTGQPSITRPIIHEGLAEVVPLLCGSCWSSAFLRKPKHEIMSCDILYCLLLYFAVEACRSGLKIPTVLDWERPGGMGARAGLCLLTFQNTLRAS